MRREVPPILGNQRLAVVEREVVCGKIEGVDFGPQLIVLARSPSAVLVWDSGHSYTSGRQQVYAESHMIVLPDRSPRFTRHPTWKDIGRAGGRLSMDRVIEVSTEVAGLFDIEVAQRLPFVIGQRRTLLVEGGGYPLRPARSLGSEAHTEWMRLLERGFVMPQRAI